MGPSQEASAALLDGLQRAAGDLGAECLQAGFAFMFFVSGQRVLRPAGSGDQPLILF